MKYSKGLYDFNPSAHSYKYYGVVELNELFARHGFKTEFFGDTPVDNISLRQKLLRPIKKLFVLSGLMPKTMAGKKILKKIVFGNMVTMPAKIGPPITSNKKDQRTLYRAGYNQPQRISSAEPNIDYKVIVRQHYLLSIHKWHR